MLSVSPLLLILGSLCTHPAQGFKYVDFLLPRGGNNNVRNAFFGALEVAWLYSQHYRFLSPATVLVPRLATEKADSMLDVFNVSKIEAAGLAIRVKETLEGKELIEATRDWDDTRCHFSNEDPEAWLARLSNIYMSGICQMAVRFTHPYRDSAGPRDALWVPHRIRSLYAAITFRDSILNYGRALRALLPKTFVAVHYRSGDKTPIPLINCSAYGFQHAPLRFRACTWPHDSLRAFVSHEEVLLDLWRVRPPVVIFVATPSIQDERFLLFRETLTRTGLQIVTLDDLSKQLPQSKVRRFQENNKALRFLFSWVDQYLCTQADRFLPSAASTWSQLVLLQRREENKTEADAWVHLFSTYYTLIGTDNLNLQLYGEHETGEAGTVVANHITRCPAGTSIVGRYCVCNNVRSKCVLDPRVEPPAQSQPGCLTKRVFSPLTFHRSQAFYASCLACRCDPMGGWG
jgi:hypothetical protein